ncbi:ArsR/SmtB family transcription factor [Microbacterium sp. NPDC058021]|uniref:ArsR/SmtB family transcription factor n=1 Tax=Microbacterium sp. NPDC058021 TaxID=3346306 RepID=UPI0036DC54E3
MDRYARTIDPFEAMAEPVRRRLVEVLADGEHTAGQLAAVVGGEFRISRTAISKHLRILRDAGFVEVRGDFQWRWYYLTRDGLGSLEAAVRRLRRKMSGGIGWDSDLRAKRDPLAGPGFDGRPVPRKGPGRAPARGRRGHQSLPPEASDPEAGLYPVFPVVEHMPLP